MVFLQYSPFSQCRLLVICGDGNSIDHPKDAGEPNTIYVGRWGFVLNMAASHVLGIYFQHHNQAELGRPDSGGSPSSSPSLPPVLTFPLTILLLGMDSSSIGLVQSITLSGAALPDSFL